MLLTRRAVIRKWTAYGLALLPLWVLETLVLTRFPVFGAVPMLLPCAVTAAAVMEGQEAGAGYGLAAGLLWELAAPGGYGLKVFGMTLAGFLTGRTSQLVISRNFPGYVICTAAVAAATDILRIAGRLLTRTAALPALLEAAVPEFLLTMLWAPVVWLLYRPVRRLASGEKLRQRGRSGA